MFRLLAFLDGRTLYGLVQVGSDGGTYSMSCIEPTGLWTMLSVDEPTTDAWLSCIRMVFRQAQVSAVRSPDACITTTAPMLRGFMQRAYACGAHIWISSCRCRRVTLQTVTDACTWLDACASIQPIASPAVSAAVDQLIAETASTGKESG